MAKRKNAVSMGGFTVPDYTIIQPGMKPVTVKGMRRSYERLLWEAEFYVHYEISDKVLAQEFVRYCEKNFDKKDARLLKKLNDFDFTSIGKYTYLLNKGVGLDDEKLALVEKYYKQFLVRAKVVAEAEKEAKAEEDEKPAAKVISIQQRIRDQLEELTGKLEGALDDILASDIDIKDFDAFAMISSYEPTVKPAHAKILKEVFSTDAAEAAQVVEWKEDDVKEAYAHLGNAKQRKAFAEFFEKIFVACDTIINAGKATRKTRVKKAPSKDKLIAKLKFKDTEPSLGLASINPLSIIDAKLLWVFNTKNRKLGVYVADEMQGPLSVKGASIIGFNEANSIQKTVRKPEEILKGANKLARTKIQKVFDGIKSVETTLNGRLNEHTILIKVF